MRLFHLADTVEVFHRAGGVDAAIEVARARRGKHFDPEVVDLFCGAAPEVLADMDAVAEFGALIEKEPGLSRQLSERELDSALEAVADFTDLRSPSRAGHSRGVAHLAATAAGSLTKASSLAAASSGLAATSRPMVVVRSAPAGAEQNEPAPWVG